MHNQVFPAYAGMSPGRCLVRLVFQRFPRLRGDEPWTQRVERAVHGFSPPTRG